MDNVVINIVEQISSVTVNAESSPAAITVDSHSTVNNVSITATNTTNIVDVNVTDNTNDVTVNVSNLRGPQGYTGPQGATGPSITNVFTAGQTLSSPKVLMLSGGLAYYFDITNENNYGKEIGVNYQTAISGGSVNVISEGVLTDAGAFIQDTIYYCGINGTLTSTAPISGISIEVGIGIDTDNLLVQFKNQIITI